MCTSVCRIGTPPGSRKSICWCCTACATASISSCSAQRDEGPDAAGACRRGERGAAAELRAGSRIVDRFADKVHVNVAAFNRAALITGEVPDEAVRAEVEKIVQGVPNVRGVTNEAQLAPITSFGERTSDSLITAQVKTRYLRANAFNPVHVKVVTEAGVVYLMGVVTEREADDAVDIARTTSGVRKVVKIFEYCKATDQVCRPRPSGAPDEKPKPAA